LGLASPLLALDHSLDAERVRIALAERVLPDAAVRDQPLLVMLPKGVPIRK